MYMYTRTLTSPSISVTFCMVSRSLNCHHTSPIQARTISQILILAADNSTSTVTYIRWQSSAQYVLIYVYQCESGSWMSQFEFDADRIHVFYEMFQSFLRLWYFLWNLSSKRSTVHELDMWMEGRSYKSQSHSRLNMCMLEWLINPIGRDGMRLARNRVAVLQLWLFDVDSWDGRNES